MSICFSIQSLLTDKLAISFSNLAIPECQYKNKYYEYGEIEQYDFTCDEPPRDTDSKFCIFHDINYLKGHNYEKHKKEVAKRLEEKLSEYSSKVMPFKFIGYCLPDILFQGKQFTKPLYFNDTTFYGEADFSGAAFSEDAYFIEAKFSKGANFDQATFSGVASFYSAKFSRLFTSFGKATFSKKADFHGAAFSKGASFIEAKFSAHASFGGAAFSKLASFGGAAFSEDAYFVRAAFSDRANFVRAAFSKLASFGEAAFSNEADFRRAAFSDRANFRRAAFSNEADFRRAAFSNEADFTGTIFSNEADFSRSTFSSEAYFSGEFNGPAYFNYTIFEKPTKVTFDIRKMSKASFSNSDITKIRFSDKVTWGGNDRYTIIEEEMLESYLKYSFDWKNITARNSKDSDRLEDFLIQCGVNWKGDLQFTKDDGEICIKSTLNSLSIDDDSSGATIQIDDKGSYVFAKKIGQIKFDHKSKKAILSIDGNESYKFVIKEDKDKLKIYPNKEVSLESVMAVYRNLRENYEYRLRYDEAGKFFTKEMELKRKYRNVRSKTSHDFEVKENCWFRRNLTLTGLYYRFCNYGESIAKPAIIGAITIGLSALVWLTQSRPALEPTFNFTNIDPNNASHMSTFILLKNATNYTHLLKAFERSVVDFDPILSPGSDIKVGIIDYVVKIVGGGLTFGLLLIALRRKFERKYTR
jgi:hypothetical protein